MLPISQSGPSCETSWDRCICEGITLSTHVWPIIGVDLNVIVHGTQKPSKIFMIPLSRNPRRQTSRLLKQSSYVTQDVYVTFLSEAILKCVGFIDTLEVCTFVCWKGRIVKLGNKRPIEIGCILPFLWSNCVIPTDPTRGKTIFSLYEPRSVF